ncbi:hypothetical protein [Amycolatopsis sp. NPDC004079]|uniref:hypothetical protein n=1 Tax=Amycolatopsis sp. NPDC004079 TaxID=3154549 RepID=UPI0033B03343
MAEAENDPARLRMLIDTTVGSAALADYRTCAADYRAAAEELERLNAAAAHSEDHSEADAFRNDQYVEAAVDAFEAAQRVLAALGY